MARLAVDLAVSLGITTSVDFAALVGMEVVSKVGYTGWNRPTTEYGAVDPKWSSMRDGYDHLTGRSIFHSLRPCFFFFPHDSYIRGYRKSHSRRYKSPFFPVKI